MTKRNYYAEAIDILAHGCQSHELLVQIAKTVPSVLVRAYEAVNVNPNDPDVVMDGFLRQSRGKIDAIKMWREWAGVGLKEAKDAVEARMDKTGFEFPSR